MAINWPNQSPLTIALIDRINLCFLAIFVVEASIKLTGFGLRYFKDTWNKFDFIIVMASISTLVITNISDIKILANITMLLRVLRLGRLFKLFKSLKTL